MTDIDHRDRLTKQIVTHVAEGGKAVGHAGSPFPVELALALDLLPVPLLELGVARNASIEAEWIDDKEDPDVRSVFVRAMRGELTALSAIISTRTTDHIHYYLREVTRLGAWPHAVPLHMFDLMPLRHEGVTVYNRGSMRRLAAFLERIAGRAIDDAKLVAAVERSNGERARLRAEAARIAADARGRRLMLVASAPLNDRRLHDAVAAEGWTVVAEEDGSARRNPGPDLILAGDPLDAIADYYTMMPTGLSHPRDDRTAFIDRRVADGGVDGILFWMHRGDLRLGWDFPPLRDRFAALGVPSAMVRADLDSDEGIATVREAARDLAARV